MSDDSNMTLKERLMYLVWKTRLVENLTARGVTASVDESLKDLIEKVLLLVNSDLLALDGDAAAGDVIKTKTFFNDSAVAKRTGTLELLGDANAGHVYAGKKFYKDDPKTQLEGTLELTGDAGLGDVLLDKTFYNTALLTKRTGTMANNGAENQTISAKAEEKSPSAGYHNGSGIIKIATAEQEKIIAGNIKSGVTILGQEGSLASLDTSDATAAALDIWTGKTAYINGVKVTGRKCYIYIYEADFTSLKVYDNQSMKCFTSYGVAPGTVKALFYYGGYLYVGISANGSMMKFDPVTLQSAGTKSADWNNRINAITSDGTNLFRAGDQALEKLNISTMALVSYYAPSYETMEMVNLGDYMYLALYNSQKIYKVTKSNMTKAAETGAYGGNMLTVCTDGTYIYGAGATTKKVFKYQVSDMAKLDETDDYGGTINDICSDGSYVYAVGATTQKVYKYDPATMDKVDESNDLGAECTKIEQDGTYLYVSTKGDVIKRLLISTLDVDATSGDYGGDITQMTISS